MKLDCVRVQNFRCIRDSGDLPLTADLTILIGDNESGKSSLLDALTCFNRGQEFQDVDISTMSPTRGSILNGEISKDTVDIVTIAVRLSTNEREQLNIPASVLPGDILRITKRLDNSYLIKGANDTTLSELYASLKNHRLLAAIRAIRRQIGSVYQGAIVDSLVKSHGRGNWKREIIGAGKVEERTLRSRWSMFQAREPQESLWQSEFLITPRKAKLMRRSWAECFGTRLWCS